MKIYKNELDKETKEIAESLLFNGNGFIGIRNIFDENYYDDYISNRHTYVNGFFDIYNIKYPEDYYGSAKCGEQMIPVIDGQSTMIYIGDEHFTMNTCQIINHIRYIDMTKGISVREVHFKTPSQKECKLVITKLTSFVKKEEVVTKYEFEKIGHDEDVYFKTHINFEPISTVDKDDPRVGQHSGNININNIDLKQKKIEFEACSSNVLCYFKWDTSYDDEVELVDGKIVIHSKGKYNTKNSKVEYVKAFTYSLEKYVDVDLNFDKLQVEQEKYLSDFWKVAKVQIKAQDNLEESINYGTYALLQSLGQNGTTSIAAKGLSGIGYEGHVFWDAEMYVFPLFVRTVPSLAKSMLLYRINMLDKALENRKNVGYEKGILFPWRTITGRESSAFFEAGMAQHHINLDITYSLLTYIQMTEDYDILYSGGWNLLVEVIELFDSLVHLKNGKYHLDKVTGPDEYSALVDDNYYTNYLLKYTIEKTLKIWNFKSGELIASNNCINLEDNKIKHLEEIASNINLPQDEKLNIIAQDRDFLNKGLWPQKTMKQPLLLNYHPLYIYRYQVCKQADAVLLCQLMFSNINDKELIENTVKYYDKVTTHDSSLSFSSYATVYAKLKNSKAYEYFLKNARLDLDNIHHNTKDGVHIASMGGTYQTVIDGFANMNIVDDKISFSNNLPEQISYLKFNVMHKGKCYEVELEGKEEPKIVVKQ